MKYICCGIAIVALWHCGIALLSHCGNAALWHYGIGIGGGESRCAMWQLVISQKEHYVLMSLLRRRVTCRVTLCVWVCVFS